MFVSAEIIAIVVSAAGLLFTLGGTMLAGFSWCIRRSDRVEDRLGTRMDGVEEKLSSRIDSVEERLGSRIDGVRSELVGVEERLGTRIDAVAADVIELKIAVTRIETPQRHLIIASH